MPSQLYDCKFSTCSTLADQSLVVWHHHATLKATQWVEEVAWVVAAATQWVAAVAATQWAAEEVRTPCFRLGSVALHSFPSFQVFVDVHSLITNRFFFMTPQTLQAWEEAAAATRWEVVVVRFLFGLLDKGQSILMLSAFCTVFDSIFSFLVLCPVLSAGAFDAKGMGGGTWNRIAHLTDVVQPFHQSTHCTLNAVATLRLQVFNLFYPC